ncbi:MAG: hypothetical protein RL365_137 [Bacteroidota bacterium]|jgi:hypothetical protein
MKVLNSLTSISTLILILNNISIVSFGQDSLKNKFEREIYIKYAPTSLLNPLYPAIHFASEFKPSKKKGFQIELAYILKHHLLSKSENGFKNFDSENKGFFTKVEYRSYFNKLPDSYFAFQLQYIFNDYKRTDTFDATPQLTGLNTFCSTCVDDTYGIRKNAVGLNVKFGKQFFVYDFIYIDCYIGLGINYLSNEHSKNIELHKYPAMADSPVGYYFAHYPGSYIFPLPTFASGLKIGYLLKNK